MSKPLIIATGVLMALLVPASAGATAKERIKKIEASTERGLDKATNGVGHVVNVAGSGVGRGADKTGKAITRVVKKVGLSTGSPASATKDANPAK